MNQEKNMTSFLKKFAVDNLNTKRKEKEKDTN
jgi:hypothetical protein